MDNITQSDDTVLLGNDPLDVVEHVLTAENLPFDRTEDGDLAFALAGDWKDYELWFAWRPEGDCLQLCCSIDLTVAADQRAAALDLINAINPRVWLGHYELWEDGEIIFRHGMALMTGEQPSLAQAAAMIDVAVEAADRFYPAFDFLVRGAKSPQDAIAACMFETVGEA
ncbi:YbjN domain-containing protein [Phenylobacterium sp.]|jgi:hypothetical protein|uniref:YbjN domain-containing protein n=1 Tax=Phenylobacterium sp. TaxID=1871053 RepID=UPI003784B28F